MASDFQILKSDDFEIVVEFVGVNDAARALASAEEASASATTAAASAASAQGSADEAQAIVDDFQTNAILSWNGRVGAVVPVSGDYTKSDVGLGNVDNTSDVNKPVSTAQQTALNLKANLASPSFTGAIGAAGGTVTASAPVFDITQTWNNAAVAFTGIKANFTSTASATASLLMDLQVAGTTAFNVRKDGLVSSSFGFQAPNFFLTSSGRILASSDGVWQLRDNAGTSFGRLQFGGATASFPSLKRSGTTLAARLADDSADAPLTAATATAGTNTTQVATTAFVTAAVARPSFKANKNGTSQTGVVTATATKVTFGTIEFDNGGYYDATNSKWTPPAGICQISATMQLGTNLIDQGPVQAFIYKNGVAAASRIARISGTSAISGHVSASFACNGTDYFEVYVLVGLAAEGDKTVTGNVTQTFFEGHMI